MNSNSKQNRLFIFDFFGVLSSEVAPKFFDNHFSNEDSKKIKDQYFIPADSGKYSFLETLKRISDDYKLDYEKVKKEFKSYAVLNNALLNKLLELRKNNYVALLSNAASGTFDYLFDGFDFDKYFDKHFISCDYKIKKPDLAFYELCYNSFNNIEEAYFFDDNLPNVTVLEGSKIEGIQYKNNKELFNFLDKFI